jgi:hypothetical protein
LPPLPEGQAIEDGLIPPVLKEGWKHPFQKYGKLPGHITHKLRGSGLDTPIVEVVCHRSFPFQNALGATYQIKPRTTLCAARPLLPPQLQYEPDYREAGTSAVYSQNISGQV